MSFEFTTDLQKFLELEHQVLQGQDTRQNVRQNSWVFNLRIFECGNKSVGTNMKFWKPLLDDIADPANSIVHNAMFFPINELILHSQERDPQSLWFSAGGYMMRLRFPENPANSNGLERSSELSSDQISSPFTTLQKYANGLFTFVIQWKKTETM